MDADILEALNELDEKTREEVKSLLKVTRETHSDEEYILAQFQLESHMLENGQSKIGVRFLRNIKKSDGLNYYYKALYFIFFSQNLYQRDIDAAYDSILEILKISDYGSYALREDALGIAIIYFDKGMYDKSLKLFELIGGSYSYQAKCYEGVCKIMIKHEDQELGAICDSLVRKIEKTISVLKIDFSSISQEKAPERKLAHYTSTYTANKLLLKEEGNDRASAFRLNTINNVNDPSEGKLLTNYLESVKETSFYKPDFDENLHAFISCFTFNHDSLNQFRLYGKEDNKEASGVSLVFNKEFFKETDFRSSIENIFIDRAIKSVNDGLSKDNDSAKRVEKQSVMRCVYIDPTSDYVHLAQRNRLTFFREFERKSLKGSNTAKAEAEWSDYKNYIKQKTEEFRKAFKELKEIYRAAIESKKYLKNVSEEDIDEIDSLLDMIILPLKYLIKHSAFQEEQECRMVYITSLKDERVQMDFGKFLYVEYEPEVKANLDKIYIAPAATQYQPYLAKLLCDTDVKIDLSNNPFRLPTSH